MVWRKAEKHIVDHIEGVDKAMESASMISFDRRIVLFFVIAGISMMLAGLAGLALTLTGSILLGLPVFKAIAGSVAFMGGGFFFFHIGRILAGVG